MTSSIQRLCATGRCISDQTEAVCTAAACATLGAAAVALCSEWLGGRLRQSLQLMSACRVACCKMAAVGSDQQSQLDHQSTHPRVNSAPSQLILSRAVPNWES